MLYSTQNSTHARVINTDFTLGVIQDLRLFAQVAGLNQDQKQFWSHKLKEKAFSTRITMALQPLPIHQQYHPTLVDLMSFVDGVQYTKHTVFTPEILGELQPAQIVSWMKKKVYGTATPAEDAQPTNGRSSSLEYYKKSLSHYMPNRLATWNSLAAVGNPTRSIEVNNFIKMIKKKEVRKQGKATSARRPLEKSEFVEMQRYFRSRRDFHRAFRVPAFAKLQFSLIARVDDMANFETADLKAHPDITYALQCKMCWSKNIMEERDAPEQILFGAMNPDFCVLVALGVYMEAWMETGNGVQSRYLFSEEIDDNAPTRAKNLMQKIYKEATTNPNFRALKPGLLGTHSNRKFPSTFARRNGCSKEDVDCRGRWRNKKTVVDRYIDVTLQYSDAKVAAALCIGGAVKYKLKEAAGITEAWLLQNVVPNIERRFPAEDSHFAATLAVPILWACLQDSMETYTPQRLRDRVRTAYYQVRRLGDGINAVEKVPIVIYRVEDSLMIDEVAPQAEIQEGLLANDAGRREYAPQPQNPAAYQALLAQIHAMRREQVELRALMVNIDGANRIHFNQVNRNVRRIAMAPARLVAAANNNNDDNENGRGPVANALNATLSHLPRTLYDLWTEYDIGVDGRKAAKDFTPAERGSVKYNYHRRKVVWDVIAGRVRAGDTAHVAIDRIYNVYGQNRTVTHIINAMRRDRTLYNGLPHPALRV